MPNPFLPSLQSRVIISLQSLLCNKQSFQSISVILLYPFHTLASLSITLTSNNSRHSLLLCVSHTLSFSFLLSLSWMGVNRQILFNNLVTTSTYASHSIHRFSFETECLVSPSFSIAICLCVLHGTARHCTALHHKTPSPMLPLIPSNHPVSNPHD